ncbi:MULTISPECIES: AI-2E family transporter [unclassified Colwellia]|uniref:AI-2E family transporter n=1 Tax=unclassified Colwellia TaxID=196834 RepID=UPI0015F759B2|nr:MULTISPECIES: AI-2E family transporter [unclassified Colwellia]MBA6233570.1 AI-2E family transporter [Colwellia sp. MB02u-7]MBA6238130.1 AI-2E family transporter [Colwellia sp. MB02u-11]MBA6257359.1 AI-2E family transporter [Colwellia sp. MB3u-28]MBA6258943.1 AI-2E family transporter [Colwellia sp. MB3u-41]MBA6299733.1 AI-2E family transporter [Colwellia sp. MB3u-22]
MGLIEKSGGAVKMLVVTAALFVVFAGIKTAANILVPFLLSVFIAIICNPLIARASRYKIPKVVAVLLVIALFVIIALSLAGLVGKSLTELSLKLPEYREQLNVQFVWLTAQLADKNIIISPALLMEYFDPAAAMGLAADMLSGLGSVMANLFLIIITVIFMLFEASSIPKKLHFALADPEMRLKQIDRFLTSVNNYLAIKTLVSIATGIIVSLMLWAFGLDFFLLWGVLAFLLNYIPNIGSIIAAVPAMSLAVLQLSLPEAGLIGLGYVVINMVMGNIVEPRYLGKGLGLSTLVIFLSLIFWGWLLGSVGMLLSVPLTMIIKIGLENAEEGRWFAILLSGDDDINELEHIDVKS